MKKILIMYATYGGGHFSAAKAIKSYIDENYAEAETKIVDCVEYINKFVNKITTGTYKRLTTSTPWLWKKVYYNSEKGILSKVSNATNKLMAKKLLHLFKDYNPDIVISTHMFATQMTGYLKRKGKINCTLATVLTDFAPHEQWLEEHEYGNFFFVSNEGMKKALINDFKVDENKITVTGIPISPKFSKEFNKPEIYKTLGLSPNKKTILLFGGGEYGLGKKTVLKVLNCLTNYLDTYQIVAVSGRSKKMNKAFNEIAENISDKSSLKVFDYVTNVPEIMSISSLVVTKPGGLTSSESLASALPMFVINPIPGQEEENAEFLEKAGVAVWQKKEDEPEKLLKELLTSESKLEEMKNNTYKLARKESTKNICDIVLKN